MRRLLPYERALIDTLGITEEEYFRFIAYQEQYKDIKDGSVLDIRNAIETVAIVLSIVGTLASVAASLLVPRPQIPQDARAGVGRRERRYSPRFGFDSAQDLAQYGDPVNLVYTDIDTNPDGGVRVASSLLWSAVHSYGGKQYMQMLATIGSSDIAEIAPSRTAFGQVPLRQFVNAGNWLYFRNGGPVTFDNLLRPTSDTSDPSRTGRAGGELAYRPYVVPTESFSGFSQAFSPSSFSEFGITSPIPINVTIFEREDDGSPARSLNGITMEDKGIYWPGLYDRTRTPFPVGHQLKLRIAKTDGKGGLAEKAAEEDRLVAASAIDGASIYKLGSAKFKVVGMSGSEDLNNSALNVTLQCTESGFGPEEDYGTYSTGKQEDELSSSIPKLKADRERLFALLNPTITVQNLTGAQQTAFNKFRSYYNQLETLLDDMIMYKRINKSNRAELDEFVLRNESLFSDRGIALAQQIATEENKLEELREDITEIRKSNRSDSDKSQAITEKRAKISEYKASLRANRARLQRLIEQDQFADQKLFNYLSRLEDVVNDIQRSFSSVAGFQVVNNTDFAPIINNRRNKGELGAREERQFLREARNTMREVESRISSVIQIDQPAIDKFNADINRQIQDIDAQIAAIKATLASPEGLNDFLVTKCLTKIQEASYETVSACKVVNFAIRGKVFMRIQGRQKQYGDVTVNNYRQSDNGLKHRSAFFLMLVREAAASNWSLVPRIFVLRRAADNDFFFPLYFEAPDSSKRWAFRFEPVFDTSSEMRKHGTLPFVYLSAGQTVENISTLNIPGGIGKVKFYGSTRQPAASNLPPRNKSPFAIDEWCLYPPSLITDSDITTGAKEVIKACSSDANISFSFESSPEFEITAVTEQQQDLNYDANFPAIYQDLTLVGFNCFSGQGVRSLRSLSAFVLKGKRVRRINEGTGAYPASPDGPSNFASDIFLDTLLDPKNGIGKFANINGVDLQKLAFAKKMNRTMGYYMDGVIADVTSWREFWAETAPYCMLELARIGGRDTLIPALPTDNTGRINRVVTISALFNQGNILEDSYKEEFLDYGDSTQDLVATIIYRAPERDGVFPKNTSLVVSLKLNEDGSEFNDANARRATFDLSQFVTSRTQALHYGMLMCLQRRHVRRAIEFQTFPTEAPVQPGSYIYVQTDENRWDNISSGIIETGGVLNAPISESPINGTFSVLVYDGASTTARLTSIAVSNGQASALAQYKGWLFVLGSLLTEKRVFRVTEVEMGEEGEVTIKAIEHPCEESNGQTKSLIARQDPGLFKITG